MRRGVWADFLVAGGHDGQWPGCWRRGAARRECVRWGSDGEPDGQVSANNAKIANVQLRLKVEPWDGASLTVQRRGDEVARCMRWRSRCCKPPDVTTDETSHKRRVDQHRLHFLSFHRPRAPTGHAAHRRVDRPIQKLAQPHCRWLGERCLGDAAVPGATGACVEGLPPLPSAALPSLIGRKLKFATNQAPWS